MKMAAGETERRPQHVNLLLRYSGHNHHRILTHFPEEEKADDSKVSH